MIPSFPLLYFSLIINYLKDGVGGPGGGGKGRWSALCGVVLSGAGRGA